MTGDPAHEALERVGPYRILSILGRGGMGHVWLGEHVETGARAAIKTVRAVDRDDVHAIRTEIQALARVRHPQIVRVVAHGIDRGMPWYAMDVIAGRTLRSLMGVVDRATTPLPGPAAADTSRGSPALLRCEMRERLAIAARLCRPLSYMHGEGVVHRDLKPENVLLTEDGVPVLVDFGVAASFVSGLSRERLELVVAGAGTIHYMSPEQIRGELVDARSDLYSLGCLIYELLTGLTPFSGSRLAMIDGHLRGSPEPPSTIDPAVTPEIDALVLALLEKEPRDRPGHADDVAAMLRELGVDDGAPDGVVARPYLYRPRLVGRDAALRALCRALDDAQRGAGGTVLLAGASGVGKTRLLLELSRVADGRDIQLLSGGATRGGGPLHALLPVVASVCDLCRADPSLGRRVFGGKATIHPPFAEISWSLPGIETAPPSVLPGDDGRRAVTWLLEVLRAVAREVPTLLALDDLQWADELTRDVVRRLSGAPLPRLSLVGAYRSEEAPVDLGQGEGARVLAVEPLGSEDVATLVADMMALPAPPRRFVSSLEINSEGNPFFVAEYLRLAIDQELLTRDAAGRWRVAEDSLDRCAGLSLPATLREVVAHRLDGLSELARRVLDVASVLGRDVALDLLTTASGVGEPEVLDALAELGTRQVLAAVPGGFRFCHDKVREVAYDRLAVADSSVLHYAAARAIESLGGQTRAARLVDLGLHWERAGELTRAKEAYLEAGSRAVETHGLAQAERLFRAYLDCPTPGAGPTRDDILARRILGFHVLRVGGRNVEAAAELTRAAEEARAIGDPLIEAEALQQLGATRIAMSQPEQARELLETAVALLREHGAPIDVRHALSNLGLLYRELGRAGEAKALLEKALELYQQANDRPGLGRAFGNLATAYWQAGMMDEARDLYEQALAIAIELESRPMEAHWNGNLALIHRERGQLAQAGELYERALAAHRDTGERRGEAAVLADLGVLRYEEGDAGRAIESFEEAIAIAREIGDLRREGIALGNEGVLLSETGRPAEALGCIERSLVIARELGARWSESLALVALAGHLARVGRVEEAATHHARADAIIVATGNRRAAGEWLAASGLLRMREGQLAQARQLLERAIELHRAARNRRAEGRALAGLGVVAALEGRGDDALRANEEALACHEEARDVVAAAERFRALADLERQRGSLPEAERALATAETILGDRPWVEERGRMLCARGHLALARGRSARDVFDSLCSLPSGASATLDRAVVALEKAQASFDRGVLLLHGQHPDDPSAWG